MMTRTRLTTLTVALVIAAMSAVGCGQPEIKQLSARVQKLQGDVRILQAQRDDAQKKLSIAEDRKKVLAGQLDGKDLEIESMKAGRDKALSDLEAIKKERPTGTTSGGWKAGVVGTEISIGSDLLFRSGRATLTSGGKKALSVIASNIMTNHPGKYIRIYGHTDSDPIRKTKNLWADNLDLSSNRAMAVARYMISRGIKGSLIESVGMGSTRPIAGNKSVADKKKNRRVEIMIIQ